MDASSVASPREVIMPSDGDVNVGINDSSEDFGTGGVHLDNEVGAMRREDHVNVTVIHGPPLDYSFQDIQELDDLSKYVPSSGVPLKKKSAEDAEGAARKVAGAGNLGTGEGSPIGAGIGSGSQAFLQASSDAADLEASSESAHIITAVSHADEQAAVEAKRESNRHKMHVRTITTGLRLSNNFLTYLGGLSGALAPVMATPAQNLMFLDVSFNGLTKIGEDLVGFPNLKVIYFHGNKLGHLGSVRKLAPLRHLSKVTFHGNPIEHKKNYRSYVVEALPTIKSLDFTTITRSDRMRASTWHKTFYKGKKTIE